MLIPQGRAKVAPSTSKPRVIVRVGSSISSANKSWLRDPKPRWWHKDVKLVFMKDRKITSVKSTGVTATQTVETTPSVRLCPFFLKAGNDVSRGGCRFGDKCFHTHVASTEINSGIIVDASAYVENLKTNIDIKKDSRVVQEDKEKKIEDWLRNMAAEFGQVIRCKIHQCRMENGCVSAHVHFNRAASRYAFIQWINKRTIDGFVVNSHAHNIKEIKMIGDTCTPCQPSWGRSQESQQRKPLEIKPPTVKPVVIVQPEPEPVVVEADVDDDGFQMAGKNGKGKKRIVKKAVAEQPPQSPEPTLKSIISLIKKEAAGSMKKSVSFETDDDLQLEVQDDLTVTLSELNKVPNDLNKMPISSDVGSWSRGSTPPMSSSSSSSVSSVLSVNDYPPINQDPQVMKRLQKEYLRNIKNNMEREEHKTMVVDESTQDNLPTFSASYRVRCSELQEVNAQVNAQMYIEPHVEAQIEPHVEPQAELQAGPQAEPQAAVDLIEEGGVDPSSMEHDDDSIPDNWDDDLSDDEEEINEYDEDPYSIGDEYITDCELTRRMLSMRVYL